MAGEQPSKDDMLGFTAAAAMLLYAKAKACAGLELR